MQIIVKTIRDTKLRMKIVKQRTSFDEDSKIFIEPYETKQNILRDKIITARTLLNKVIIPDKIVKTIARLCKVLKMEGLRNTLRVTGDRVLEANLTDVKFVIHLCLRLRLKRGPLDIGNSDHVIRQKFQGVRDDIL